MCDAVNQISGSTCADKDQDNPQRLQLFIYRHLQKQHADRDNGRARDNNEQPLCVAQQTECGSGILQVIEFQNALDQDRPSIWRQGSFHRSKRHLESGKRVEKRPGYGDSHKRDKKQIIQIRFIY